MPSRILDYPIFDADNHMYETPDALTKFLDDDFKSVIKYIDIEGRTKITVKGTISEYIPNPTFEVVARPGAGLHQPVLDRAVPLVDLPAEDTLVELSGPRKVLDVALDDAALCGAYRGAIEVLAGLDRQQAGKLLGLAGQMQHVGWVKPFARRRLGQAFARPNIACSVEKCWVALNRLTQPTLRPFVPLAGISRA